MSRRTILLSLLALCTVQLLLALAVIPPWQEPDEPQHVITARVVKAYGTGFDWHPSYPFQEHAIMASMARHGWWRHYGRQTPDPLPPAFRHGTGNPAAVVDDWFGPIVGPQMYYRLVAALFQRAQIEDATAQLYVMRGLSALAGLLTVVVVWAATRRLLDDRSALVVTTMLALLPQFILVSTSATPDAMVNLAGAVVWYAAVMLTTSGALVRWLAVLWAAAIIAFMIRRMGALLVVFAFAVTIALPWLSAGASVRRAMRFALGLAVMAAALGAVVFWIAPMDMRVAFSRIPFDAIWSAGGVITNARVLPGFLNNLLQSFWLNAGWLRYPSPPLWHFVAMAIMLGGIAGVVINRRRLPASAAVLAGAAACVQLIPLVVYHFGMLYIGPQGRHLFPVLPAILTLVWLGWRSWLGPEKERVAAPAFIVVVAALNITGWGFVLLQAYA